MEFGNESGVRPLSGASVVQKFTRPITREIEIGGERLALTFSEQGIAVRPVGSRKPPKEITWAGVLTHMAGPTPPTPPPPDHNTPAPGKITRPPAHDTPPPARKPHP